MKYLSIFLFCLLLFACKEESKPKVLTADAIVNKSIEVSGGEKIESSVIDNLH